MRNPDSRATFRAVEMLAVSISESCIRGRGTGLCQRAARQAASKAAFCCCRARGSGSSIEARARYIGLCLGHGNYPSNLPDKAEMKILIAGFQHETNTFVELAALYQNFVNGETFPALRRGQQVRLVSETSTFRSGASLARSNRTVIRLSRYFGRAQVPGTRYA